MKELNSTIIEISHKTRFYTVRKRFINNLLKENDHNNFIWSIGKYWKDQGSSRAEIQLPKNISYFKPTQLKPNQFEDLRRRFEDKERVKTNKRRRRKYPADGTKKIHFCSLEA